MQMTEHMEQDGYLNIHDIFAAGHKENQLII